MNSLLQVKQVSLTLPRISSPLLQHISLSIEKGDLLVIIGPSGAGKTTLLRLLNRLQEPSMGSIELEEKPIVNIPVIELRKKIVLVSQEPKLLGMTAKKTLHYPLKLQNICKVDAEKRVNYWINKVHIPDDWLEKTELQLSLGQRQLIAITRALLMEPKILILDEPTSALDAGTSHHLLEVLIELSKNENTGIIMVNHDLEISKRFATQVIYMERGEIKKKQKSSEVDWENLREQLKQAEKQKILMDDL